MKHNLLQSYGKKFNYKNILVIFTKIELFLFIIVQNKTKIYNQIFKINGL